MSIPITIVRSKVQFSPFVFYTDFLQEVAHYYQSTGEELKPISFQLFEHGDERKSDSEYRIAPISIPLLLSLFEQLSKFHKCPLRLDLHNNSSTVPVLQFLARANFFDLIGSKRISHDTKGKNIMYFDEAYLGDFDSRKQRNEHKVRCYSLSDGNLEAEISLFDTEEEKRDYLNSVFTYKVKDHFAELLFDNQLTNNLHNVFIDILSELITNGVLHSGSNTYALMFVDRLSTKFSISDNGVGLKTSMSKKKETFFYVPNTLSELIARESSSSESQKKRHANLRFILETLYFSSLKERAGLFDLMINVVLHCKGYFRLHSENTQIIVSNRMMDHLVELSQIRKEIILLHASYLFNRINENEHNAKVKDFSKSMCQGFCRLYQEITKRYTDDVKYSSVRFFNVRFRGVHIEVEIPNL